MTEQAPKLIATIKDCKNYFEELSSRVFAIEWKELSETDKAEIKDLVWAEIHTFKENWKKVIVGNG